MYSCKNGKINMKVEFYRHNIDESDISRVEDVLRSIFLTTGDVVLGNLETDKIIVSSSF